MSRHSTALVPASIPFTQGHEKHSNRPVTPLIRDTTVHCLPYIDQQPDTETRAKIDKLVADQASSLLRTESAYLDGVPLSPAPARAPVSLPIQSNSARLPPSKERSALDIAIASGASATAAYRAELAVRFGDAAWRERCEYAEKSLRALRRHRERKETQLGAINRRRAAEQRRVATRLAKLSRKYRALVQENIVLGNSFEQH